MPKKTEKKRGAKNPKAPTKKPADDPKVKPLTGAALAKAVGVSRNTIISLRREQGGPKGNDVEEWQKYLMERASESDQTMQVSDAYMPDEIKRLRAKLLRAQAGKEDATRKLKELQLKRIRDDLVPLGDAKKAMRKVLGPLRELLDQMPKAAGGKANPSDPVHGEEAIREHLDGIFQSMDKVFSNE